VVITKLNDSDSGSTAGPSFIRGLIAVAAQILITGALLFISAGRADWLWAWIYVGVFTALTGLAHLVMLPRDPGLAAERRNAKRGAPSIERVHATLMALLLPAGIVVVAGLGERFGWPPLLAPSLHVAGLVLAVLGYSVTLWALASNTFFSSVVRIQEERGHRVITSGPYRYVRHPGYGGFLMFWIGSAVALSSVWALVPVGLLAAVTVLRILYEEKTLREGLDGYIDYTGSVRYRLVPGIW
jgi:protein-S-isoprenylcysteine O-methyltransferase Ste14